MSRKIKFNPSGVNNAYQINIKGRDKLVGGNGNTIFSCSFRYNKTINELHFQLQLS